MATLKQIIQREVNPFDSVTFTTGNFWTEDNQSNIATVESIHQSAITQVQNTLKYVIKDNCTRSILLTGDSGCGKSYVLKRLKKTLNDRALFVYIEPCLVKDYIWRHTLRHTVDGLMHIPEGEKESQLLLWLKGLSAYKDGGVIKKLLGAKNHFVRELRSIYPTGIYQPRDFFSILYSLTNSDLYFSACDWLRGNSISEAELKLLGVSSAIETEEAAKGIIANFGRISTDNKPIVLCFDQVEVASKTANGSFDLSPVFNVNTAFHNNNLKNFLVIISIVRDIWMNCQKTIPLSDLARINNQKIILKQITLEQVKALWANRLYPLHAQANPKPISPIAPLDEQKLEDKYPGGKANLRASLSFGGILYEKYKSTNPGLGNTGTVKPKSDLLSAFKLLWKNEFNQIQGKITRLRQFSSPELVEMLISAINVLAMEPIKPKLLSGKYATYSFSYQSKVGIIWDEDNNLTKFSNAMKACQKLLDTDSNINLFLIRSEFIGNKKNKGYQIYQQIFNNSSHRHIQANLESVHYLKTYRKLVNDARSGDLVLNYEPFKLPRLQELVRQTKILEQCKLLQELGIVKVIERPNTPSNEEDKKIKELKDFLLNFVKHHQLLGQVTLIKQAKTQFYDAAETKIEKQIQQLIKEQKISIIAPQAKPEERLICLIPEAFTGVKK